MLINLLRELVGPDGIRTISLNEEARFREIRQLRKEVDHIPIIMFEEGMEGLQMQIEFAISFCDTVVCSSLPTLDINIGYRKCRVLDNRKFMYMVSNNQEHIDTGKKLGLEVLDV